MDTYISRDVPVPEGDGAKALHKNNLVKDKKIFAHSIKDHLIPQVSSLTTTKEMFWPSYKFKYDFDKLVEECEECTDHKVILYKDLSNQRTTWSHRRRSGKCRSCDNHLEWPPRIMGFIHSRNVFQKEVINFIKTLGRAHTIRSSTHNKRKEDGSNWISSSHHQKKIPQAMRNVKN